MNLMFKNSEIPLRGRGLSFDDVLMVPTRSEIKSRREPSLQTRLTKKITLEIPILSANMDTVTEVEMALAMAKLGGLGILHRFVSIEQQVQFVEKLKSHDVKNIAASIGVNEDDRARTEKLVQAGVTLITIDIAHGHSQLMLDSIKFLKDKFPQVQIIAGNVATGEATLDLIEAGADAIKVGIGPGSMCTTRIITGCGVPQLTAIALCAEFARASNTPIIADGGLRTSGDIAKALAAGAQTVMLGGMLAGTMETPGEIKMGRKQYRGMASKAAQESWRGGVPEGMAAEGESEQISVKGFVKDVVLEICGGLRSGMSYLNSNSILEMQANARFIEMSSSGVQESRAHGVRSF
jgi:IMP dehydrogenase